MKQNTLNMKQVWIIYPDDIEKLQKDLLEAKYNMRQNEDGTWSISQDIENASLVPKSVTMIKDGPLKGARVEKVHLYNVVELEKALKNRGWGSKITKRDATGTFAFIFDKSKLDIYAKRFEN